MRVWIYNRAVFFEAKSYHDWVAVNFDSLQFNPRRNKRRRIIVSRLISYTGCYYKSLPTTDCVEVAYEHELYNLMR